MEQAKIIRIVLLLVTFVCAVFANSAHAKSVYAITDHEKSTLRAYDIQVDQLEYQDDVDVTDFASGAVGITISSQLGRMFITYEGSAKIVWAKAKTMEQEGFIDLGVDYGADQLAGVVADEEKELVYTVERAGNKLYILGWNAQEEELELRDPDEPSQPYSEGVPYITLMGLDPRQAYGLALDGDRLYVSNNTTTVHCYDTGSWAHLGTRDVGRNAADLAIDPNNGEHNAYLYIGAYYWKPGTGHNYLVKHDLEADPCSVNHNTENNIGTVPIGLGVDPNSGLVYVGTSDKEIRVYDCSEPTFVCTYSVDTGGSSGPAGICVPKGDVSYIPPFEPSKTDNIEDCVPPRDGQITYTINYDYQWDEESDPAPADFDSIIIVDELPMGVDFMSATPSGTVGDGTVIWSIDPNLWAGPGNVELVVQTNKVTPGGMIENNVEIIATIGVNEYVGKFTLQTPVCDCTGYGKIIYVDIDATEGNNDGSTWLDAYTSLQSALAESWPCDEVWVAEGTYRPTSDPNNPRAKFRLVSGVGVYGGFVGG